MYQYTREVKHPVTGETVVHTSETHWDSISNGLTEWLDQWYYTQVHISAQQYNDWITLAAGADTDAACYIMGIQQEADLLWAEVRTIKATLKLSLVDTPNPSWQNMKVSYHRCPSRYFGDKPRMTMSLQGFLQKILRIEPTQDILEKIHKVAFWQPPMPKSSDFTFGWCDGDSSNASEVFTRVYTNITPQGYSDMYPSVLGSCMRHKSWDFRGETIGANGDYPHPVTAYCTPDIAIAWLEDANGYTVARTLINKVKRTLVRHYCIASGECNCETHRKNYWQGLRDILESHIADIGEYDLDEDTGLLGCSMKSIEILDGDAWIAPYVDGNYKLLNLETMKITDERCDQWISCDQHMPPTCSTNGLNLPGEYTCWHCGEYFDDNPYYYNDHIICECCYENNYGYCECCDSTVPNDDLYRVEDIWGYYCEDCLSGTFVCAYCNNRYHTDSEAGTNEHGESVCNRCAERHYIYCAHCDTLYDPDDVTDHDGDWLCDDCYTEATKELEATNE